MGESEMSRTVVKTYVPGYQKDMWEEHAEKLDMSQSEFVRAMVQAGRHGFEGDGVRSDEERQSSGSDPGGSSLEKRILDALEDEPRAFDELLVEITDNIEQRLDETLQSLQSSGQIRYSGREEGYVLADNE